MNLTDIQREYETILHSNKSDHDKAVAFAELMSIMEGPPFNVPLLRNPEWEEKNKSVRAMYRKISRSRIFD